MPPKRRRRKLPGSIYVRKGYSRRIYIEYKGKKIATGLLDTPENYKLAEDMLEVLFRRDHGLWVPEPDEPAPTRDVEEIYERYEQYLRATDKSLRTIEAYRSAFEKLKPTVLSSEAIERAIVRFVESWHGASSSVNIHLRNYAPFIKWAHAKGHLTGTIVDIAAYKRKGVAKKVQVLLPAQIEAIVAHLRTNEDTDLADLVELMYATGLRISEAITLRYDQILEVDSLKVLALSNKTTKEAEYHPLTRAVEALLEHRRQHAEQHPMRPNNVFPWRASSISNLTRRYNATLKACGIEGKTGFHLLRKSFRHRLQMANVPVDAARRLMRHSSLRVTDEHYTLYEADRLREILEELN